MVECAYFSLRKFLEFLLDFCRSYAKSTDFTLFYQIILQVLNCRVPSKIVVYTSQWPRKTSDVLLSAAGFGVFPLPVSPASAGSFFNYASS